MTAIVSGTPSALSIDSITSDQYSDQADVLSLLLFGKPQSEMGGGDNNVAMEAAMALVGGQVAKGLGGGGVQTSYDATSGLSAGVSLSRDLFLAFLYNPTSEEDENRTGVKLSYFLGNRTQADLETGDAAPAPRGSIGSSGSEASHLAHAEVAHALGAFFTATYPSDREDRDEESTRNAGIGLDVAFQLLSFMACPSAESSLRTRSRMRVFAVRRRSRPFVEPHALAEERGLAADDADAGARRRALRRLEHLRDPSRARWTPEVARRVGLEQNTVPGSEPCESHPRSRAARWIEERVRECVARIPKSSTCTPTESLTFQRSITARPNPSSSRNTFPHRRSRCDRSSLDFVQSVVVEAAVPTVELGRRIAIDRHEQMRLAADVPHDGFHGRRHARVEEILRVRPLVRSERDVRAGPNPRFARCVGVVLRDSFARHHLAVRHVAERAVQNAIESGRDRPRDRGAPPRADPTRALRLLVVGERARRSVRISSISVPSNRFCGFPVRRADGRRG